MAFTMHSHSGEFCPGHAHDQLEDLVRRAEALGFRTMALTEHMPRTAVEDLYPEEIEVRLPPPRAGFCFASSLSLASAPPPLPRAQHT